MKLSYINAAFVCIALATTGCSVENTKLSQEEQASLGQEDQVSTRTPSGLMMPMAVSSTPGTLLASENQSFTVPSGSIVAYGAVSIYIQKTFSGTVTCSNATFGQDPVPMVVKACYLVSATTAPVPSPSGAPGVFLANENQSFTVASNSIVAYGANSTYIQKAFSGTVTCSNATFGQDPVPMVVKACYLASATTAPTPVPAPAPSGAPGVFLANENQSFTVASGSIVAYGANSIYVQSTRSGTVTCSNAVFGNDPVPGVVKACYLVSGTATTPPAPTPTPVPAPAPAPAPSGAPGALIAVENQSFTVSSGSVVAFGANSSFIQKTISGTSYCTGTVFGGDPATGVVKACYLVSGSVVAAPGSNLPAAPPANPSLGCGKSIPATGTFLSVPITAGGRSRNYNIVIPANYNPNETLPLFFGLHGNSGTANGSLSEYARMPNATKAEKAIYVYPQGLVWPGTGTFGWEESCGGYDMQFFIAMIDAISSQYCVNTKRVFAFGFSWGGDMSNALACCLGPKLRAVAPMSGTEFNNSTNQCVAPAPAYRAFLGGADPYYSGDSLNNTMATMASLSKCTGGPIVENGKGCEGTTYNSSCTRRSYTGCQQEVSGTTISGAAHQVYDQYENLLWDFFSTQK